MSQEASLDLSTLYLPAYLTVHMHMHMHMCMHKSLFVVMQGRTHALK